MALDSERLGAILIKSGKLNAGQLATAVVGQKRGGVTVTLVMKDPLDIEAVETVRALTNLEVHKAVSTGDRIVSVIDRFTLPSAACRRTGVSSSTSAAA